MDLYGKLLDKIAEAVGVIYDPMGLKSGLRHTSEAIHSEIANRSDLPIEERVAMIQEYHYLITKSKNRQKIVESAHRHLSPNSNPQAISNDWMIAFW